MNIPFADLKRLHDPIKKELNEAIERVINKNSYILGEEVEKFEEAFARYCGINGGAGVSSGTDALELILRANKIGNGDEVITVPNTFIATASAIAFTGAKPVFVDCGEDYLINVDKIEEKITERTRAMLPVHLYGQSADMGPILMIAKRHNLAVVEDACQAHGADYHGMNAGSLGDSAAFSFYPGKNLGGFGDGGIVVSDDKELIKEIKMLRNYGQSEKYHHDVLAFNRRLDGLQAAILNVKLKYLNNWNDSRRRAAKEYTRELEGVIETPIEHENSSHIYHLYVIKTDEDKRDELQKHLKKRGIDIGLHYPMPIHLQKAFRYLGYKEGDFPNAEKYAKSILSLPMFPEMKDEEIAYVIDSVKSFYDK